MNSLQFLGHSFFKASFGKTNVLFDPFIYTENKNKDFTRLVQCPVTEKQLKNIDLIFVSHEHFDHFDKKTIEAIAKKSNSLVVSSQHVLSQLNISSNLKKAVDNQHELKLRGLNVSPIHVHHPQAFYPLAFLVSDGKFSVFHAGDTDLIQSLKGIKADVALLPIGGKFTMDIVDAVRTVKMMKPKHAVPMHYNTFEMIKANPKEFTERIEKSIVPTKPIVLKEGETIRF